MATAKRDWLEPPDWWKKWKPLRWVALITITVSVFSTSWTIKKYVFTPEDHPATPYYTGTVEQRVSLAGFRSYDSVDAVSAALTAAGQKWAASSLHSPRSELYPRHEMDTLTVESFHYLDSDGQLTLEFFNNRLYEASFVPKDPAACARALHAAMPELKRDRVGDAEWIEGFRRVASNVDLVRSNVGQTLGASPFVIWQDRRLIQQRDQWDRDFGSLPIRAGS